MIDPKAISEEASTAAVFASQAMYDRIGGDRLLCGFAWVTIYPQHKGNTKAGKEERKIIRQLHGIDGQTFELDYTGKAFELWNPGGFNVQNVDIKEAGAKEYAAKLRLHGFKAYANSRLD